MFDRNRSGQAVFFSLVSALSGNSVTGQGTGISGRVTLDGGAMGVVAGAIDEPGGGQYRLLPFAADTNGNVLGFYFTASGCVPVSFTVVTQQNVSGRLFTGSGLTFIASGSNVVSLPISGQVFLASGSVTSGVISSGIFVTATASVASGSLYLASGSIFMNTFASGVVGGGSGNIPSAWGGSGAVTIGQNLDKSGYIANSISGTTYLASGTVIPASGSLSGQLVAANVTQWRSVQPNTLVSSGRLDAVFNTRTAVAASGTASTLQDTGAPNTSGIYDGQRLTLTAGTGAGQSRVIQNQGSSGIMTVFPAWITAPDVDTVFTISPNGGALLSGSTFLSSGQAVSLNSGQSILVYSGQLSGQLVTPQSGVTFIASGSITSGVISSGIFVTAVASVASGSLYLASGSIFMNTFASGVVGGGSGNIPSAWGGSGATTVGQNLDKSGYTVGTNLDKTGYGIGSGAINSGAFVSGMIDATLPDAFLRRNFGFVSGLTSGSNMLNANRKLINQWDTTTNSGRLTVFNESGTGQAYTQDLTALSGAPPITALGAG